MSTPQDLLSQSSIGEDNISELTVCCSFEYIADLDDIDLMAPCMLETDES